MKFPEKFRVRSTLTNANMHVFRVLFRGRFLHVIASDWGKWQHVSVSLENRTPVWDEMCHIKNLFFDEEETCVQFHPRKSEYVNLAENCLHMWKLPSDVEALLDKRVDDIGKLLKVQKK